MDTQQLLATRFGDLVELGLLQVFAASGAIGLLIGLERERHKESKAGVRTGEIIVNVMKDGSVVVHRKKMGLPELEHLLRRSSELYPEQEVVLRADRKAYHEQVVPGLHVCARAKIWNISFAATQDGQ